MKKSENVWGDREELEEVWKYIKENPLIIGLPISESKGIDLLSALRDVYETSKKNPENAQVLLTLLANVLVAAAQGDGEEIVEEVIVQDAMLEFENSIKEILDEGR